MSNILIIKHGSLGDIAQASGAIQDISDFHKDDKIYLLTSKPYIDLFKQNPHLEGTILDKRLSRFNLIYLFNLMRKLKKYKFIKFLSYKILLVQVSIKKYYFLMPAILFGHLLKLHYQMISLKLNLIKILF